MNDVQLEPFFQRIRADRDQRLADILQHGREERHRLLGQGYASSRGLQRETTARLRQEQRQNRERRLSRTRADIRHRRWQELARLQKAVTEAVMGRIGNAWDQPELQWEWCRYWLVAAHNLAGEAMIRLRLGKVDQKVQEQIEQWLTENAVAWRLSEELPGLGLRIRWSDYELDGTLAAQQTHISETVLQRLAPLMPHIDMSNNS